MPATAPATTSHAAKPRPRQPVRGWTDRNRTELTVELLPGRRFTVPVPAGGVPRFLFFAVEMPPQDDAQEEEAEVKIKMVSRSPMVRLSDGHLRDLGIPITRTSFAKLLNAGFIRSERNGPNTLTVDLGSLFKFLQAVRVRPGGEGPTFWTPDRIRQYQGAFGPVGG